MLNRVTIAGRMARDPELRHTNSGTAVTSFTLAVDRDFKGTNCEKITDWIDCVAWKGSAEFVARYFQKGAIAIVDGRLQVRDWTDNNGNKRRTYEVIADTVHFGGGKREDNGQSYNAPESEPQFDELDDDLPPLPF